MGATVCEAVAAEPDMHLVAAADQSDGEVGRIKIAASLDAFADEGVQVAVDFTQLEPARHSLPWLADNGMHAVVGTTGFTSADLAEFRRHFTSSNCVIAPNFAIGAVLMIRMAELAAPHFDTAEIIEFHHDNKVDAPSGTATHTAQRMAAASGEWADDPTRHEVYPGARGGLGPGGIRVHSVRMRGTVANQEVILGTTGQSLTIRHDTVDRTSFMPGVLIGVKRVAEFPGVTVGLDTFLGL